MSFNLRKFKEKFLQEAKEKTDILMEGLLLVESQPENLDKIKELMRAAHTIKGSSKMMGFVDVSEIAHSLEDRLLDLIDGRVKLTKKYISLLIKDIDKISSLLFKEKTEPSENPEKEGKEKVDNKSDKKKEVKEEIKPTVKTTTIPLINYLKIDSKRIDKIVTSIESIFFDFSALSLLMEDIGKDYAGKAEKIKNDISLILNEMNNIRLLPLSLIFEPQVRNVRDLSIELKKDIKLKIEGKDVLVEKRIIDSLSEPLIHLIRNAIDHGIETPEERLKKGKNSKGIITLKGYQKKDKIFIEVRDDGRGIAWDKVKEKAIEKGLLSPNQKVKSKDLFKIITSSGFSVKDKVTNISGRGIGMDIVFDIVQNLNGKLFVESKKDKGTIFTLSFPKNLSVVKSLIMKTGDLKFAIPLSNIEKIIKKEKADFIDKNGKAYIYHLNDTLPVINAKEIFETSNIKPAFFIIIYDEYDKVALLIDEILSYEDLIIKNTGTSLKQHKHILGNSIIGSGEIITVFDPESLIELAEDRISLDFIKFGAKDKKQIKILILEDSELTQDIIVNSLTSKGFFVKGVENGVKGLEELKTFTPDIIISDIDMPEMDGITFFRAMKTMGYNIPVMFLSSREEDKEINELLKLGAFAFMKKSEYKPDKVANIIKRELNK